MCGGDVVPKYANNLNFVQCTRCSHLELLTRAVTSEHYEEKTAGEKTEMRVLNAISQVSYAQKYCKLDATCDVGCGDGTFVYALTRAGYTDCFGLEPSKKYTETWEALGIEVVPGTTKDLSAVTQVKKINTIAMMHVVEHIDNPRLVLDAAYECLGVGGALVIETPNARSYMLRRTRLQHDLVYPEHINIFSLESLTALLADAGFRVVASGQRDFNDGNLSISGCLVKLGLRPYLMTKNRMSSVYNSHTNKASSEKQLSLVKNVVRSVLNRCVKFLGREDYIWVVAKKISC